MKIVVVTKRPGSKDGTGILSWTRVATLFEVRKAKLRPLSAL
jgi:hypothetical protein